MRENGRTTSCMARQPSKADSPISMRPSGKRIDERLMQPQKAQAEIDEMKLRTGVMNIDELRAQYDLPTVEGGDKFYISTNLAELGSEKLRGAAPQEGGES